MLRQLINGLKAAIVLWIAVCIGSRVAWSDVVGPANAQAHLTRAEFNQVFADAAAAPRSGNTPGNREKLRNIGWKYLNALLASK